MNRLKKIIDKIIEIFTRFGVGFFFGLISIIVWFQEVVEAYTYREPKGSTIPKFRRKLMRFGYHTWKYGNVENFCQIYPEKARELILTFYHTLDENNRVSLYDKGIYFTCLSDKSNYDLLDMGVTEIIKCKPLMIEAYYMIHVIGELIYLTKESKYKNEYLNYVLRRKKKYRGIVNYGAFIKLSADYDMQELKSWVLSGLEWKNFISHEEHRATIYAANKFGLPVKEDITQIKTDWYEEYFPILLEQDLEKWRNPSSKESTIVDFVKELNEAHGMMKDAMEMIKFCQSNPEKGIEQVKQYYRKSPLDSDRRYYLECLKNSENHELFDFLIGEMKYYEKKIIYLRRLTNAIENFMWYSANKKFEDNYIEYIRDNIYSELSFGSCLALQKIRSEKAEDLMLQISQDSSHDLSYMAFEYLAKCKNVEKYQSLFESYKNSSDADFRSVAKLGLRRIKQKKKRKTKKAETKR